MSNYVMTTNETTILFQGDKDKFSFKYEIHDVFFVLTSFVYRKDLLELYDLDLVLKQGKEKETILLELFSCIHDFSKEKSCEVIFTHIFPTNLFYSLRGNLKYRILSLTQRNWLKKAVPSLFKKEMPYYYLETESFSMSMLIENIVMFSHHFTRDLKRAFPLFDHKDITEEFYYEGHQGTFSYEIQKGKLYVKESSANMDIPFSRNEEEMKEAMTPYFEKWKQKGRVRNTINPSSYFTKRYFKEQHPMIYHQEMVPKIQSVLPFTERELEMIMYRTCNCYAYEIVQLKKSSFISLFQVKDVYLLVDLITKHAEMFTDEKQAHEQFMTLKNNQKKTV